MGYPVTVPEMVWPLQRYRVEDMTPEANRAWTRYLWDNRPDMPVDGLCGPDGEENPEVEATVEACPIQERRWFVEHNAKLLKSRKGIKLTVIADRGQLKEAVSDLYSFSHP